MTKILVDKLALEQALEALEYENSWHKPRNEKPYVSTLDAITALRLALADGDKLSPSESVQEPVDVGNLEYRGNSVGYIYQKMTAYRNGIDAAWDALRAKGIHPDGKTRLAEAIARHTAPPKAEPVQESVKLPTTAAEAELIVQECIRLCDQVDIVGADECIDNIKEHFEVGE